MWSTGSRGGWGAAEESWTTATLACSGPCHQHANILRCRQQLATCHVPGDMQCAAGWCTLALMTSMQRVSPLC